MIILETIDEGTRERRYSGLNVYMNQFSRNQKLLKYREIGTNS
jgi:hypothetical protein